MILDLIGNRERYSGLGASIERALEYLADTDFTALEDGRHPIDGEAIFALVSSYDTEPESARSFEAHRKYIDVQYLLTGRENLEIVGRLYQLSRPEARRRADDILERLSLTDAAASAPGQVTVAQARSLYRWGAVSPETACFGVIGCPVSTAKSRAALALKRLRAELERLGVDGEDLDGVWAGTEFLKKMGLREEVTIGRHVAVIGGGNTAIDCTRNLIRLGVKEVSIV